MSAPSSQDGPRPADTPPGQIQWERNPPGCSSPVGCMYVAVGIFILLLIAMLVMSVMRVPPVGG